MTVPESPAGAGRFDRLRRGLRRTREGILGRIGSLFRGSARSEDWSGELEEALKNGSAPRWAQDLDPAYLSVLKKLGDDAGTTLRLHRHDIQRRNDLGVSRRVTRALGPALQACARRSAWRAIVFGLHA